MDNFITREENDFKNIFNRFRKRNFSGNTGQAIKNSSYQLATNIVTKTGSLIFTIIIARMLLPEKMGLYSLALSTILLFAAFSDLGVGTAIMTFVSKTLGRNKPEKAKAYFSKLLKWKIYLVILSSGALLASAHFVANNFYNKPIFYALLVGALYIPATEAIVVFERIFRANNNFKTPLSKEIIFQVLRLTLVPIGILLLLKSNLSNEILIALVIMIISMCYLVAVLFLMISSRKRLPFLKLKTQKLSNTETKDLKRFVIPLSFIAFSGVFGYVDTLMLGHFVAEEFLAYYGTAFNLIGSGAAIIGFISAGVFPLFSKLEGKSLQSLFKKSRNMVFTIALIGSIFTYFVAWWVIRIAYGTEYLQAVPILRWFSILILIIPMIGIYSTYLTSQKKTKVLAWVVFSTTILNIMLNFIGIKIGLNYGMFEAVLGATFATIISRFAYLGALIVFRNKD